MNATLLRKISPFFAHHHKRLAAILLLAASAAALTALEPLVIRRLFDTFVTTHEFGKTLVPFGLLAGILLGAEMFGMVLERQLWRVRLDVSHTLLESAVENLQKMPLSYHRDHGVGGTITKVERGIASCMIAFADLVGQLLPSLVYLCVSITVMLRLDTRLSLAVLVLAPLPALVGAWASGEQVTREQGLLQRWTRVFTRFNEVLSGITMVKSFAMEEREKRRLLSAVGEANGVALRGVATDSRNTCTKNALIATARMAALALGGALVMRHQITIGTLIAFIAYAAGVFQPVQRLTGMYQTVRRAGVALESLLAILDTHRAQTDDSSAHELGPVRGAVAFRDVSFEYRPGIEVLRDVNLSVQPGESVALVGSGGTGKSTLMALLQRLYDPTSGSIYIDGQDLRHVKPSSLRSQIGVVLQEPTLLDDTVRDNIAFGREHASLEEIEEAARAAHAHEFISALPNGYETKVGERGCKLSAGERQRITIARALLKDAPILVLDQATAGLDAEASDNVHQAVTRLTQGKTTFIVADTPAAMAATDRVFVLKEGTIAEAGRHDEQPVRRDGHDAALARRQGAALALRTAA
jgi:ATP-binding cassette subfamily B protein